MVLLYGVTTNKDVVERTRYIYGYPILIALGASMILFSCGGEAETTPNPANNLEPLFSFGHEGDHLLMSSMFMTTDKTGSIFFSETHSHMVQEFSFEGEYRRKFGREGRGPGEFINPQQAVTDGERLYVQDVGNKRLVMFSLEDDGRSEIIPLERSFGVFQVYREKFYGSTSPPGSFWMPASEVEEKLIKVYDKEMHLVDSFGEYLSMVEDISVVVNAYMLEIDEDVIHLIFSFFPIYRAYSSDGILLAEQDFSDLLDMRDKDTYYDEDLYGGPPPGSIRPIFRAMDVSGDRIFLSRQGSTIVIDEYLFDGNGLEYTTTHLFENLPENNYVGDFFYHEESNSFYILEYTDVPRMTVY